MKIKRVLLTALLLGIVFLPATPVMAAATLTDLSQDFVCQCGCTLVLGNCTHGECGPKTAMTAQIGDYLSQGKTGPEITALMVARYGEQVLSAPPKRGFNLTAWILPFVAILLGGVVVYSALVAWVRRGQRQRASELVVAETTDEKYQHRLEDELSHFTEMGFR